MKFTVIGIFHGSKPQDIEADTPEQAIDRYSASPNLCHKCVDELQSCNGDTPDGFIVQDDDGVNVLIVKPEDEQRLDTELAEARRLAEGYRAKWAAVRDMLMTRETQMISMRLACQLASGHIGAPPQHGTASFAVTSAVERQITFALDEDAGKAGVAVVDAARALFEVAKHLPSGARGALKTRLDALEQAFTVLDRKA